MDFDAINIYLKEKFTLMSEKRGRKFRFIKYNGHNYEEIKSYLNEYSPNTQIWDEKLLHKGWLYTYSGKNFQFKSVSEFDMRCVIASNPLLIIDDEEIPLFMDALDATAYLKESDNNIVFNYNDILATFKYDKDRETFLKYNPDHKNGVDFKKLPYNDDWYIGHQEDLKYLNLPLKPRYDNDIHLVAVFFEFNNAVESIEKLKYDINQTLSIRNQEPMFTPTWENYKRRKTLSTRCENYSQFAEFVSTLYKVVYEETKVGTKLRQSLGDFSDHWFTKIVGGLRHRYQHGEQNFNSKNVWEIKDIYSRYLKIESEPKEPTDYTKMQYGIIEDFQVFLYMIKKSLITQATIKDSINEDERGNLYCGRAVLPEFYSKYKGCPCVITKYKENTCDQTRSRYCFFCYQPDSIKVNKKGIIVLVKGIACCEGYKMPSALPAGTQILIRTIKPASYRKLNESEGDVIDYVVLNEDNQ